MIKNLFYLQTGLLESRKFNEVEITKRCHSLHLSRHQDFESVHSSGVNSIDIEKREHRYLLSGCSDGSVYIHDVVNSTGRTQFTAKCVDKIAKTHDQTHRYSAECVSWYGNDSALFITSGTDKTLKIWDANASACIEEFHSKGRIFHHACSSVPTCNPIIAVASSLNCLELIDLRTGSSVHELRGHKSSILTCTWSPAEENLLASGGIDKSIYLWDIRASNSCLRSLVRMGGNKKLGETAHSGYVNGLKFTEDGLILVSIGTDNKIRLWETFSGLNKNQNLIEVRNDVKKNLQFAISSNSKPALIYVPSEGNIIAVELFSGTLIDILHGHFHLVNCCFYRSTLQELYSGGNDRNILLWTADEPLDDGRLDVDKTARTASVNPSKKRLLKLDAWSSDDSD